MNVYFACSITGGREFESIYQKIVAALTEDGHEIPTSHLAQSDVIQHERELTPQDVYERDTTWIKNCDALIAEVSVPSHGVGYEIGFALQLGKPVLCLHQQGHRISKMITGNPDRTLCIRVYNGVKEAISQARSFLAAEQRL